MAAGGIRRARRLFWTGVKDHSYGRANVPGSEPSVAATNSCVLFPLVNRGFIDTPPVVGVGIL